MEVSGNQKVEAGSRSFADLKKQQCYVQMIGGSSNPASGSLLAQEIVLASSPRLLISALPSARAWPGLALGWGQSFPGGWWWWWGASMAMKYSVLVTSPLIILHIQSGHSIDM